MIDKLKMWLMTEENKQKYLMDKEKSEREDKRREKDDELPKKERESKDKNQSKKQGGLFGKKERKTELDNDIPIEEDIINNEVSTEDKPKKVVVVKRKTTVDNNESDNSSDSINPFDNIDNSYFNNNTNIETEKDEKDEEVLDTNENLNFDVISDLYKKSEKIQSEKTTISSDADEDRKKELVVKKKDEEDKYMTILLDLPPTTDEAYFIKRAFEDGIPEWFLRSKGYIEDSIESIESIKEEKAKDETVNTELNIEELAVQKIKEELKSVSSESLIDEDILDDVMEEILENESQLLEDEVINEIKKTEEELISNLTKAKEDLFEVDLSLVNSDMQKNIENSVLKVENSEKDYSETKSFNVMEDLINEEIKALEKNKDEEIKKSSSVIISELRNRMKSKKLEDGNNSVDVTNKSLKEVSEISNLSESASLDSRINLSELKLKAREAIKAAVKESVNVKVESDNESKALVNVEERLKSLKRKREVLSSNGNNILVKEDIEVGEGKVVTNYKSYNVSEEDKNKIEVGKELDDSDVLLNENEVLIDGEVYNISKEEEIELIKKYSTREIWILSEDSYLLEKYKMNLENSRYVVNLIKTEKDFIMAIRSVDNLIIFTKDIPKIVEKSVAGFIKYLKSEQRKARLVTIEESKINSKMMEFSFIDLTIESLDNYYIDFDLSLYREIRKPISELYKQISFDLTSELMENDFIEISLDEFNTDSRGDIDLDFNSSRVLVGISKDSGDIKSKQGDFELKLDDTIVINLDDLK